MGIEIRRIRPDEAEVLKHMRLTLLADSPAAFGSTLDRELAFTDETWAERAAGSATGSNRATFLAFEGEQVVGIVGAGRRPGRRRLGDRTGVDVDGAGHTPNGPRTPAGRQRVRLGRKHGRALRRTLGDARQQRRTAALRIDGFRRHRRPQATAIGPVQGRSPNVTLARRRLTDRAAAKESRPVSVSAYETETGRELLVARVVSGRG